MTSLLAFTPILLFVGAWMWFTRRSDRKRLLLAREKQNSDRDYLKRYDQHMEKVEHLLARIADSLDRDQQIGGQPLEESKSETSRERGN